MLHTTTTITPNHCAHVFPEQKLMLKPSLGAHCSSQLPSLYLAQCQLSRDMIGGYEWLWDEEMSFDACKENELTKETNKIRIIVF